MDPKFSNFPHIFETKKFCNVELMIEERLREATEKLNVFKIPDVPKMTSTRSPLNNSKTTARMTSVPMSSTTNSTANQTTLINRHNKKVLVNVVAPTNKVLTYNNSSSNHNNNYSSKPNSMPGNQNEGKTIQSDQNQSNKVEIASYTHPCKSKFSN